MDRCTLNKGAFAFKIVRGALKWPLMGGSRLIEVAATAGLTVYEKVKAWFVGENIYFNSLKRETNVIYIIYKVRKTARIRN